MRLHQFGMLLIATLWTMAGAQAADVYEIDKRVETARAAFEEENAEVFSEVTKEIEAKDSAEREKAKPNLDRIKTLKAEREQLEKDGKLPSWVATKYKTRLKKNCSTLVDVLESAKNEYVKAKEDKKAEALVAEIEQLKVGQGIAAKPASTTKPASTKPAGKPPVATKWKGWPKGAPLMATAPFTAEEAVTSQEAWAKYMKVEVEYTNKIGMKFRLIPPGEFLMGSSPVEAAAAIKQAGDYSDFAKTFKSEMPQHQVTLTHPVYMSIYEVTQSQYEKVMGKNPANYSKTGKNKDNVANLDTSDHPVETVAYVDAAEFCARLSVMDRLRPFYNREGEKIVPLDGNGYRVPTEAEWEFACRAGTTTKFWASDNDDDLRKLEMGWNWGSRTQPVGKLKPNPFGLYDIVGNVREWTDDYWQPNWYEQVQDSTAINPNCQVASSDHVVRGGCFVDGPVACRSAARIARPNSNRGSDIGFRVVLPVSAVK